MSVDALPSGSGDAQWFVYLLECEDGSLYTGVAKDVCDRFMVHLAGKGAAYTRSHVPVRILASRELASRGEALRAEIAIKRLPRSSKLSYFAAEENWASEEAEVAPRPRG